MCHAPNYCLFFSFFYILSFFSPFGTTRTQAHHFSRSRHTFPQHLQTHLLIFYCHSRRHSHSDTFRQKHFISSLSLHAENGTFCFLEVSEHALQGMPWQGQTRRGVWGMWREMASVILYILIIYTDGLFTCVWAWWSQFSKYRTMSISRFKYDGFVSTCRCAACVKNRKAVAPYMGGAVLCDTCGRLFFGAQVRAGRDGLVLRRRETVSYICMTYTHTLSRA